MQESKAAASTATTFRHSPYVGPRPFTTADRDLFFGRNQEAIELSSLVKAHPEVLLYAPSGAGKTSLLYAQVLPILESDEDFDMLPLARVRSQESAIIPDEKINNIYVFNALKDLSNDKLSVLERAQLTLADFLARHPRALSGEWERQPGDQDAPERRLPRVIVFDQFEEIFSLYPERYKDREGFFKQVTEALEADPFLRVVFSMREDYIAELDPYTDILPQGMRTRFRLERLRKINALACVKRPLESDRCKETRRYFESNAAESLVDRLLAIKVKSPSGEKIEVPGEFVDPVQLQVVCQTLWEKLPPDDNSISREDIDKYANVDEALLDFYESSIRKAVIATNSRIQSAAAGGANSPAPPAISEAVVRGWFEQRLITRENKRNMVNRERQMTAGLPNVVVDELENQHLIRVELRGGEPWYELSHDRFIAPIRESNRRFLLQQPVAKRKAQELEERAEEWWNAQRDSKLLLDRGELADAQNWMRTDAAAIGYSNNLYALIQASEAAIQHEENLQQQALADALHQKAVAERQRADALQEKATAEQQKAMAQRQRSRQLKIGWVVTSVLLLFTVGSTVFAVDRWRKASDAEFRATKALGETTEAKKDVEKALAFANDEKTKANTARGEAETALAEVERQKDEVELQKGEAERQKAKAEEQRGEAERQRGEAEKQKIIAEGSRKRAEEAAEDAKSAKWAGDAKYQLTLNNPEIALRLAMMAFDVADTNDAETNLRLSYQALAAKRVLKGHGDVIRKAIYSPDGRSIFTASEDHTVKQWNALTNELVKTFEGHTNGVHDIEISADGRFLATEASDATGRIWNVADGTSIHQLDDLSGPVAALAFSPDGRLLATEASDTEKEGGWVPRIWDVRTGKIVHRLKGHTAAITALAFSPDGKFLVTASWDHTARLWDTATGKELQKLSGHTAPLASVAFSPIGTTVVTGSYDSTARIWDIQGQKGPIVLRGHTGVVQSVAFSPTGQYVLTSGQKVRSLTLTQTEIPLPDEILTDDAAPDDNSVRMYDPIGRMIRQFSGHTGDINSASFSQDGRLVVTASEDGTAKVWKIETGEKILDVEPPGGRGHNYAALSPDNTFLLAAGANKTAQVWRVDSLEARTLIAAQKSSVANVAFTDQNTVLTSGYEGVQLWDANTGSQLPGGSYLVKEPVSAAALSPNGRYLVTGSRRRMRRDMTARLWENGTPHDLKGHANPVVSVAFSPRGTYILTVSSEAAKIWRTADRTLLRTFKPDELRTLKPDEEDQDFRAGAFSKDESYVALGSSVGAVLVVEVTTGTLVTTIEDHSGAINSVAFNAETVDPLIVTSSDDGTARVCAATTGKCLFTLRDHIGSVTYAGFSADNRLIVTIGVDRVARIWDANQQGGNLVAAFTGYTQTPASAALNLDGTRLAVGTNAGQVFISDCKVCSPIKRVRELAEELKPRSLTLEEIDQFLTFRRRNQEGQ